MSDKTGIQWTEATWNPWHGCHKISPGCKNCYMFRDKKRYGQDPNVVVRSKTTFNDPLKWKEPKLIFTCSWSDWFVEEADAWRDEAWDIIRSTQRHTYQILTKCSERIAGRIPDPPLPNVWLGVSVESRDYLYRIDHLRKTPAAVRFLSLEPLLEDLGTLDLTGIHWVICGGESGAGARPMHPEWARSIRDQCIAEGVPYFFKQWGEWAPFATEARYARGSLMPGNDETVGGDCGGPGALSFMEHNGKKIPCGKVVARFSDGSEVTTQYRREKEHRWGKENLQEMEYLGVGKKKAGRLLDGRTWDEMPEVSRG